MSDIIVVEDDEIYKLFLENRLTILYPHLNINFFTTGEEAIKEVTEDTIVAIVDFMLDDIVGSEVIKGMRLINPNMEFIVLSGTPIEGVRGFVKGMGIFEYIQKDENDSLNILRHSLNTILGLDRLRKEIKG